MITIIGGSGFIGTRLCKRLKEVGEDFLIVDKINSKSYPRSSKYADVRNYKELFDAVVGDAIINLAAEHRDDVTPRSLYDEVNVEGARNVCNVAKNKKINTIIFTSSVAVYGFAPLGTDENGRINYFNDYGRTKYEAEVIYKDWYNQDPLNRKLLIVRPTVVFGEQNRGNVYNLLRQIASGKFLMIGDGLNRKSMAYVENVAAFLQYGLKLENGVYIFNYIDKPDFDMNTLVSKVNYSLGRKKIINFRLPFMIGFLIGKLFDFIAYLSNRKFAISSIRVKKFCSNSMYETSISTLDFVPPVKLEDAIEKTIKYEFIEKHNDELFYSE
ncbi:MAG: NAD-dependent epimerase/dehydratase family protein [Campylobacterales bacterium]|nr:NAD-dependent epimerase/dehydratase family protein [Campylobacterales bacterium]